MRTSRAVFVPKLATTLRSYAISRGSFRFVHFVHFVHFVWHRLTRSVYRRNRGRL
ncbi:MAG: hypothetical protein ABR499_02625 [Gemmatimonadaceae bacterium]